MFTFFNGFLVPYPLMPKGWQWANRVSPTSWILEGLSCVQLCDSTVPLTGGGGNATVQSFVNEYFGFSYNMIWWCVLIIFGYCLFFRALATIFLAKVNYQKR